jgi:hypothetical protein
MRCGRNSIVPRGIRRQKILVASMDSSSYGLETLPVPGMPRGPAHEEEGLGEPLDHESNAFAWETVELNVPGSEGYRPGRP